PGARMKAPGSADPTIERDSRGPVGRAFGRLADAASALKALGRAPAAAARVFDGEDARGAAAAPADEDGNPIESDDVASDVSDAPALPVELFVTRETRGGIRSGRLDAQVGLIKSKGSEWYWGKFRRGATIALKSGSMTLFISRVTAAKTIKISSMRREDFAGVFTAQRLAGKTVYQLRRALVQELRDRQARRPGAPTEVSLESRVRLVRFLSATKAQALPENRDESSYPPAPRAPVALPAALQGLNHLLPKVVLLDMRLYPDGMPYAQIEDMSKLMKSGVYFVLLSDKPRAEVETQLTRRLTTRQRDQISRYKMIILSDDGNSLSGHDGNFSRALPSERFTPEQLEVMQFLARTRGLPASIEASSTRVEIVLEKGADAEAFRTGFVERLKAMRADPARWSWTLSERGGRPVVTIRPRSLASAVPHLFEVLREREALFVNPSDTMLVTRDASLRAALKGSLQPAAHLDADGEALGDAALASLLGPYRENKPGDLAASASKIQSFLQGRDGSGGSFSSVYMMTGHVMHSAFNWAIWRYRNDGVLPSAEETVAVARKIWEEESGKSAANSLTRTGESLAGFYETVEQRLRAMHAVVVDVLKVYPIAVGTELPNLFVIDRYKKGGALDRRDVFRLIFDFVVARETADGKLDIAVVDFKTGQVPTLQNLEKDTQVQLYDMLVRRMWKTLPLPYGGTGTPREVADVAIKFLYTAGAYKPSLNDWTRLKFDKFLNNVMNRIRRRSSPPKPKAAAAAKPARRGKKA
ncbi:MAG: hypothetical protein KGM24_04165, partial [Elusimicrobia bacterium]|nr:hypothetical protein [Elusimicrobiota bacterium]